MLQRLSVPGCRNGRNARAREGRRVPRSGSSRKSSSKNSIASAPTDTSVTPVDTGAETSETIVHDFWEEVWILEGELTDLGKKQTFTAGMYACRPPGMVHGPYRVPKRCVTLEMRYFKR